MSAYKHFNRLFAALSNIHVSPMFYNGAQSICRKDTRPNFAFSIHKFSTTPSNCDLKEFFDDEENWNVSEVKVGRSWRLDELRIKSNPDLHKLWYVLLKERNMLLTMEHEYKDKFIPMPSPERLCKVNESMKNLETVVKERNKAYYELETGETGGRQIVNDHNGFGLPFKRKLKEHYVEKKDNEKYKRYSMLRHRMVLDKDVVSFLKLYNEKQRKRQFAIQRSRYRHVCGLFKRFGNLDEDAVKSEFPDVDIEEAKRDKLSRGPRVNVN